MQAKKTVQSQKLQLIGAWQQSGLSQKQFCLQNTITHSTFYYWYRVYKSAQKKTESFLPHTITRQSDELMALTGIAMVSGFNCPSAVVRQVL